MSYTKRVAIVELTNQYSFSLGILFEIGTPQPLILDFKVIAPYPTFFVGILDLAPLASLPIEYQNFFVKVENFHSTTVGNFDYNISR